MTTKRSFLGAVGVALLLAFGMPGWAVAQTEVPGTAAILDDSSTGNETTGVNAEAVEPMYSAAKVTWTVAAAYLANCGTGTGESGAECAANETPLTGFAVYYGLRSDFALVNAEGMVEVGPPGRTAGTTGDLGTFADSAMIEDLKPGTRYYFRVAAKNSVGIGAEAGQTTVASIETTAAPVPEQVARVEVTPGDMKLMVSWDEPRPDKTANRTNHVIAMYHVQYRTSQTATNQPGDWMPTKPMEVSGAMQTAEITGLTNGMMYDVQVRAVNDATGVGDWSAQSSTTSGTPMGGMTPTPALPLVGAFGLGFGLLAAGRARLRRRAQLQLTR